MAEAKGGTGETGRIIVVDDEPELRGVVAEYLAKHGLQVRTASGGAELDGLLRDDEADLLILDVNMPGEDGISVARRMRTERGMGILMLTAMNAPLDRVVGLEIGADDYVTKPFDLRELLARVRAVLRRTAPSPAAPAEPSGRAAPRPAQGVRFGRMTLDLQARCLLQDSGEVMDLTAMECDLLSAFAQNPNRVLSRDRLLDLARAGGHEPFDRSIDVRVARLRRKVEHDPANPQAIRTVRGAGYMFAAPRP